MERHGSHPIGRETSRRVLLVALALTTAFLVIEVVGAFLTNSLALLADAGHMVTDVASLSLALFAIWFAARPHSPQRSYGYYRVEILAALGNGFALWLIAAYIFFEAAQRFQATPEVQAGPVLVVGAFGLAVNLVSALLLFPSSETSLNVQGAFLHVVGDLLGSLGVIAAALLMLLFDWFLADPIISVLIGLLILFSSGRLIWRTVHILLEGTPPEVDLHDLEDAIRGIGGVFQVHDLHAWTLTSGYNAMTAHVVVEDAVPPSQREALLDRLRHLIPARFSIQHVTIQIEESSHCCEEEHLPDGSGAGTAPQASPSKRRSTV